MANLRVEEAQKMIPWLFLFLEYDESFLEFIR